MEHVEVAAVLQRAVYGTCNNAEHHSRRVSGKVVVVNPRISRIVQGTLKGNRSHPGGDVEECHIRVVV